MDFIVDFHVLSMQHLIKSRLFSWHFYEVLVIRHSLKNKKISTRGQESSEDNLNMTFVDGR